MSAAEIFDLVTKGGAIGVLIVGFVLVLRGDVVTKASHSAELEATRKGHAETVAAIREGNAVATAAITADRDEWKTTAKELVSDVGELSEALTTRNRIDEDLRKAGVVAMAGRPT